MTPARPCRGNRGAADGKLTQAVLEPEGDGVTRRAGAVRQARERGGAAGAGAGIGAQRRGRQLRDLALPLAETGPARRRGQSRRERRTGGPLPGADRTAGLVASGSFSEIKISQTANAAYKAEVVAARRDQRLPRYTGETVLGGDIVGPLSKPPADLAKQVKDAGSVACSARERPRTPTCAARSAGQQLARVHDPGWVEPLLDRAQRLQPEGPDLGLHICGVVAADCVVVGDRGAVGDDCLRGGTLYRPPLLQFLARFGSGDEREVERGAVGIGVGEVAEDQPRRALGRERVADRRADGRAQVTQPRPAVRGLQRLDDRAGRPSACRAGRGPGSGRAPRSARRPVRGRRLRPARSSRTVSARLRATDSSSPSSPTTIRQPPRRPRRPR